MKDAASSVHSFELYFDKTIEKKLRCGIGRSKNKTQKIVKVIRIIPHGSVVSIIGKVSLQ